MPIIATNPLSETAPFSSATRPSAVELANPIELPRLYHLMHEYTQRLNETLGNTKTVAREYDTRRRLGIWICIILFCVVMTPVSWFTSSTSGGTFWRIILACMGAFCVLVLTAISAVDYFKILLGQKTKDEIIKDELRNLTYLAKQTTRLVNQASTYREHYPLSEGDKFEIELHLFDAEQAIRIASSLLKKYDK